LLRRKVNLSEVIPYASTAIAVTSLIYSIFRNSKEEVKNLEHRITVLEQNEFCQADRVCLYDIKMKMNLFWGIIETEFPKFLKKKRTPKIDRLLEKARMLGIDKLSSDELEELQKGLDFEYELSLKKEDEGRALTITLFKAIIKYYTEKLAQEEAKVSK
jgi:hypothetical protein